MENNLSHNTSAGVRIIVMLILSLVGLVIATMFVSVQDRLPKFDATLCLIFLQDIFVFILPAILAALFFYRRPWKQLRLNRAPSLKGVSLAVIVCIVSIPALNWIVAWNQGLHLPQSMAPIEQFMRDAESTAQILTNMLLSETRVLPMLVVLFVVGFMAGLSEEIFFRGGMLRMLKGGGNSHLAVWGIAIVFSAMHMQFFGFFPRMLLGAWLGYLLVWTRSLWVPIIAHALNNSLVVVSSWLANVELLPKDYIENIGVPQDGGFPVLAVVSAIATVAIIVALKRSVEQRDMVYPV